MSTELSAVVGVALLKIRRSVVFRATCVAFVVAALVGGVLHVRAAGPGPGARSLGLMGTKAQLRGGIRGLAEYLSMVATSSLSARGRCSNMAP